MGCATPFCSDPFVEVFFFLDLVLPVLVHFINIWGGFAHILKAG